MKIQYASDLHLEFSDNYSYLKHNPLKTVGDILVLAGDIGYLNDDNYRNHPLWEHDKCFSFIRDKVESSSAEHIIVVTHHVPSFQLASPDFAGSRINGAFTVELEKYIEASPIDYWIYGHSHRNIDKVIRKTRCVTNQLGYVYRNEHHTFSQEKFIEI